LKALVLGATGYVGSAIARDLFAHGYATYGLARSENARAKLEAAGIIALEGDLARIDLFAAQLTEYDVVVFAAMVPFEAEAAMLGALVEALRGASHILLFLSGSGVVSLAAQDGSWNENSFAEEDAFPFPELPTRQIRLQTESAVLEATNDRLRTFVVRPPLIWGHGGSIQVPQFFESGRRTGSVCYLGEGLNLYSNVHVDDVAAVCRLAIEHGKPGSIYHAVAGEVNFRSICEAVAHVLKLPTRSLNYQEACDLWGSAWVDMGLAVNSRIRAPRTRNDLGWEPVNVDLVEDIRSGSYYEAYHGGLGEAEAYSWKGHGWSGHAKALTVEP